MAPACTGSISIEQKNVRQFDPDVFANMTSIGALWVVVVQFVGFDLCKASSCAYRCLSKFLFCCAGTLGRIRSHHYLLACSKTWRHSIGCEWLWWITMHVITLLRLSVLTVCPKFGNISLTEGHLAPNNCRTYRASAPVFHFGANPREDTNSS
jgi:hypothetical protein